MYTGENIQFTEDPLFPGGTTIPNVSAGKVIYKIAAFFPKNRHLGALSELGEFWVSECLDINQARFIAFTAQYFHIFVNVLCFYLL